MTDHSKSQADLLDELAALRERVEQLEQERDTLQQSAIERIHAENQLKSSQVALQRLIQQIPIGIQVFDTTGLCTDVNNAHCEIFGVHRADLVGKYNIFYDPLAKDIATSNAAWRALAGETVQLGDITFNFARADARYADVKQAERVVNVTLLPIFDHEQKIASFVGLNMDVTQRNIAENQLRMNEERYRALVEDQQEMLCRFLPDGTLTFVNQAYCNFRMRSYEQLVGTKWQTLISEKNLAQAQASVDNLNSDMPSNYTEYPIKDAEGNVHWIHWINRAFFDENDQIVEYQGMGIDITEKKLLEQHHFEVALERERTKILSDFVVQAAHEFRTPLSIINSSAYAMTRTDDTSKREERLDKITRQVAQITRLLESMTLMSRLDSGASQDEHEVVNLNQLLEIVFFRAQSNFERKGLSCELILSKQPLIVHVQQKDFVRAVESIFENSLKYTQTNGEIIIQSYAEDDAAVIKISDTGDGIDSEILPHIFERFYRLDKSGKTPGLGLGLPIAQALLQQYGGTIDVNSEIGKGTIFTITLKLASPMQH